MNKLVMFVAVGFFCLSFHTVNAATETMKMYPISDGVNFLYDDENQTVWSDARNYQGPLSHETNIIGENVAARSDTHSGKYRIYRASLVFDTSILPDDAIIESSRLNLFKEAEGNNRGGTQLVITEHSRQVPDVLSKADWYLQSYGSEFARVLLLDEQYTTVDLGDSFLDYIDVTKPTFLGAMTNNDYDNIDPGFVISVASFYSNEKADSLKKPYLEVTYTIPDVIEDTDKLIADLKEVIKNDIARKAKRAVYLAQVKVLERLIEKEKFGAALVHINVLEKQITHDTKKGVITTETADEMKRILSAIKENIQ